MTDPGEYECQFVGVDSDSALALHDAGKLGYYTPGLLRMRLDLTRGQVWMADHLKVMPEPDRTSGQWRRWSIELVEHDPAALIARVVEGTGTEAPIGAYKSADDVRAAFKAGKLPRAEAERLLRTQFGYK